ncbi:MAG TPA: hypothetical protein VGO50_02400 [Pyrinomonadaceae bacterium]|jgi:hypothetical protein|nr:hypothetical protein [Pyrinomonadaceae bacterium]
MPAQTKMKRSSSYNEEAENLTLYIEDYSERRGQIVRYLRDRNYDNIVAPDSINECVEVIRDKRFRRAIIDNNLSDWVGNNKQNSIKIDGADYYKGVELAQMLESRNKGIQIGLYSSFKAELRNAVKQLGRKNFEILEPQKGDPDKFFLDFLDKNHKLEVITKPLHKTTDSLPAEIQAYYAKKVINSLKAGQHIWTAGKYSWMVGINMDIPYFNASDAEIEQRDKYTTDNPENAFFISVDKNEFRAESVLDKSSSLEIRANDVFSEDAVSKTHGFIHKYFVTQTVCKKYLEGQATVNDVIQMVKGLGDQAIFESQKILFKGLSQAVDDQIHSKEDVYELLKEFHSYDFPKILDIYKGRVDAVENGVAHVNLQSYCPEGVVRKETFGAEFLKNRNVDLDSVFEYTIYNPGIGGSAFHIEPT